MPNSLTFFVGREAFLVNFTTSKSPDYKRKFLGKFYVIFDVIFSDKKFNNQVSKE